MFLPITNYKLGIIARSINSSSFKLLRHITMSAVRINQLSAHAETNQNSVPSASIPHIVHHIWFSTPLPKKIVFPDDEEDRGDIFEKLKEEHNANHHIPDFRLILWTNGADNLDLKKFIDENELKKIEIHDYNLLRLDPECQSLDETDEEIMKFMTEELSHPGGNPVAASDCIDICYHFFYLIDNSGVARQAKR
jgi:hypothetical protein